MDFMGLWKEWSNWIIIGVLLLILYLYKRFKNIKKCSKCMQRKKIKSECVRCDYKECKDCYNKNSNLKKCENCDFEYCNDCFQKHDCEEEEESEDDDEITKTRYYGKYCMFVDGNAADYKDIFKRIEEIENEGYEFISSNTESDDMVMYIFKKVGGKIK